MKQLIFGLAFVICWTGFSQAARRTAVDIFEMERSVIYHSARASQAATQRGDHWQAKFYAARIEINVIRRLEASKRKITGNDQFQNCELALEELISYAKSVLRVLREDLKEYDEQAALEKYHEHLIECGTEVGHQNQLWRNWK